MVEIEPEPRHLNGALGMARGSTFDSQGSQFYIVQNSELSMSDLHQVNNLLENQDAEIEPGSGVFIRDYYPAWLMNRYLERGGLPSLDGDYTVFGQVFYGMDVVNKIAAVETDGSDKPLVDVVMTTVEIRVFGE